ncbi:MAG TPA: PrsW family glutamic-type intramembrane protease [Pyrinomonadaceae bacterium]
MKLRLTVNSGTLAGKVYELQSGFLTIGRGENCSIRFDPRSERIASKQHAFIEARADGFYITDNKSLNGTLVNGARIDRAKIRSGDTIQFGRNGATASVEIAEPSSSPPDLAAAQLQQIQQAANHQPDNLQNSMSNIGLGQLEAIPEPSRTGRYVGIGVTIFAIVFMALVVIAIMFLSVGIVPAIIASIVAFLPAIIYLFPLVWLDRYDPEPLWLLSLAFAWGALVAVIFSIVVNSVVAGVAEASFGADAGQIAGGVISAPVFEEASKGVGLVILLVFFRRYFDDILDGIVFAGVIALGFATVENVQYYGNALGEAGLAGLVVLFFMRGILSPFAHVTFTAMTGIGCGIARESHNTVIRILAPVLGYLGAVFLHALWNGMAILGGFESFLLGYLFIEIPFFLIFVVFAFYIMHRQNKILREMLAIDIARGLIPKEHGETAVSAFKSSGWLIGGLFSGKFRARSRYLRAIGKLGLSYWHIQRATAAQGETGSFQQNPILREEVLRWRDQV